VGQRGKATAPSPCLGERPRSVADAPSELEVAVLAGPGAKIGGGEPPPPPPPPPPPHGRSRLANTPPQAKRDQPKARRRTTYFRDTEPHSKSLLRRPDSIT